MDEKTKETISSDEVGDLNETLDLNAPVQPSSIPELNPSKDEVVAGVKERTDALLAYLKAYCPDNRCRSLAITNYEQASMWAVKSNFT